MGHGDRHRRTRGRPVPSGDIGPTVPAWSLPTLVFAISAAIAFATGTSFGTMSIMIPLAIPLAFQIDPASTLALATSAAVLSGATWGDHCSPISDTTVLSSTGTGCDHAAHVATRDLRPHGRDHQHCGRNPAGRLRDEPLAVAPDRYRRLRRLCEATGSTTPCRPGSAHAFFLISPLASFDW